MSTHTQNTTRFLLLLAAASVLIAGCGEGFGGLLISDADEVEIGREVDTGIEADFAIAEASDPAAVWASQLVAPLEAASAQFRDPNTIGGYKVEVIVDDELINAFAAPGGFTYITTGLILEASSCAEIAGVMGHELGHVTNRHGVKNIESAYGTAAITEFLLGEGAASAVLTGVHSFLLGTTYSQDKETESDITGVQIAFNAGYNPYGLVDFFVRLQELQGGSAPPQFLSSHPANDERIAATTAEIENRYGNNVNPGTTQSYECIGTTMSLSQVQESIRAGVSVRAGTGTGGGGQ